MWTAEAIFVSSTARMIVELNIKHYRDLLKTETDPAKRRTIADLLAEEETKLAKFLHRPQKSDER